MKTKTALMWGAAAAAGLVVCAAASAWAGGRYSGGNGSGYAASATVSGSLGNAGLAIASSADQVLSRGTAPVAVNALTITEGMPAVISAANDLRISLPALSRLTWDAAVVSPVFGGTAAGSVAAAVTYENERRTLVIDVQAPFGVGGTLTVTGLRVAPIAAARPSRIELDVTNDGGADAYDPKTVRVHVPRPGGSGDGYASQGMTTDASLTPIPQGTLILLS